MNTENDAASAHVHRLVGCGRSIGGTSMMRCYVCNRLDKPSKMVNATFTKDYSVKHGHRLCFDACNTDLVYMCEPWRWKIYDAPRRAPNARGLRAGADEPAITETGAAGSVNTDLLGRSRFYGHCRDCRHLNTCNLSKLPEGGCVNWEKPC